MLYPTQNDERHQQSLTKAGIVVLRILNSFWMLQGKTRFFRGLTCPGLAYMEAFFLTIKSNGFSVSEPVVS